eukprot:5639205-Prymnesium_polylepis.1
MVATLPVAAPSSASVLPALPARSSSDCDDLGLPPCPDCSKAEKPAISRARRTTLAATSTSSMTGAEALCSRGITVFCALASATAFATSSELQLPECKGIPPRKSRVGKHDNTQAVMRCAARVYRLSSTPHRLKERMFGIES